MLVTSVTPRTFILLSSVLVVCYGQSALINENVRPKDTHAQQKFKENDIVRDEELKISKMDENAAGMTINHLLFEENSLSQYPKRKEYHNKQDFDTDSRAAKTVDPTDIVGSYKHSFQKEKKDPNKLKSEEEHEVPNEKLTTYYRKIRKRRSAETKSELQGGSSRVIFSAWENWMPCDVRCGATGSQVRTRTCYSDQDAPLARLSCNYDNLVDSRSCVGPPCTLEDGHALATGNKVTVWSNWSPCSITCGKGGRQLRTRSCMTSVSGASETTLPECKFTKETRPCQYSTSCATWEVWSSWSTCSKTCSVGTSFRSRKCVVHRYFSPKTEENGTANFQHNKTHSADSNIGNKFQSNQDTANQIKLSANTSEKLETQKGILFLNREQRLVFVVDVEVPRGYEGALMEQNGSDLYEEMIEKVILDPSVCETGGESFKEQIACGGKSCNTSEWSSWRSWSACSATCGAGISRKERTCLRRSTPGPCQGRRFLYRRCYQPPCWSSWSEGTCSASCGPGYRERTRRCMQSTFPKFGSCPGPKMGVQKCYLKSCFGGNRCPWSSWGPCSSSCGGGFKHRNRTCGRIVRLATSHELAQCNKQPCPTWNRWSPYSCCNVSCGRGHRERFRTCNGGRVGEAGCNGNTVDVEYCYRKPCGKEVPLSSIVSLQCGSRTRKTTVQLRIFMGKQSQSNGWPWQASWQHRIHKGAKWRHFCGGSLIHQRWIITAGHCIEEAPFAVNHEDPGRAWSAVLGMSKLYKDGERFYAERIFVHPDYEHSTVTNSDVAMIKLRRMVEITNAISPVCLPGTLEPERGEKCVITGWGFTAPNGNHSENLLEASVPIVDFNECQNFGTYYRHFLRRGIHICAGDPVRKDSGHVSADSCTGDSGGPLVCKNNSDWYLAAVTSFGFADCGTPNHVGIYTPVKTYQTWIRGNLEKYTYDKC